MSRELVIVGCGGFGREILGLVTAGNSRGDGWQLRGFVDDRPSHNDLHLLEEFKVPFLGNTMVLREIGPCSAVIAVGSNRARASLAARLREFDIDFPYLVHPDATLGLGVVLGPGAVVAAGARLNTRVVLGAHAHVDQNVAVGHDAVFKDFARANPSACISGSTMLEEGCLVGAGATVLQGLTLGSWSVVGASGCVVKDVPPGVVVKGVPAK